MNLPPPRRPPPRKPKPGAFKLNPEPPPMDPNDPVLHLRIFPGSDGRTIPVGEWLEEKRIEREPFILVARRILKGEFDKQPKCVLQAAYVGMRKSRQPECVAAVERLKQHKDFTRVAEFVFRPDDKRR